MAAMGDGEVDGQSTLQMKDFLKSCSNEILYKAIDSI